MRRYVDLEGKLKFDSLILKKQAISEVGCHTHNIYCILD